MGAQLERMMDVIEKEDKILKRVTELTSRGIIEWSPRNGRSYVAQYKGSTFEFFALINLLRVDNYGINTETCGSPRGPVPFESLDREIQTQLRGTSFRREPREHLKEILDKLS